MPAISRQRPSEEYFLEDTFSSQTHMFVIEVIDLLFPSAPLMGVSVIMWRMLLIQDWLF